MPLETRTIKVEFEPTSNKSINSIFELQVEEGSKRSVFNLELSFQRCLQCIYGYVCRILCQVLVCPSICLSVFN